MDAYYIDASVVPFFPYAAPAPKPHPQTFAPPPHLVSQRRMQELVAPSTASSSSAAGSASSAAAPLSSLTTVLTASDIEERLADALQACRDAIDVDAASELSSDDDLSDDEFVEREFSSLYSDEDEADDEDDDDEDDDDDEELEEPEPVLASLQDAAPAGDSYERRMRRICDWRTGVATDDPRLLTGPELPPTIALALAIPTHFDTSSRKRKAADDESKQQEAHAKRVCTAGAGMATPPLATCAACGHWFSCAASLQHHGSAANPNEACRAAIAYCLEV